MAVSETVASIGHTVTVAIAKTIASIAETITAKVAGRGHSHEGADDSEDNLEEDGTVRSRIFAMNGEIHGFMKLSEIVRGCSVAVGVIRRWEADATHSKLHVEELICEV